MSDSHHILTVNTGSTSIKIAVYDQAECRRPISDPPEPLFANTVGHDEVETLLASQLDSVVQHVAHRIVRVPESMAAIVALDDRSLQGIRDASADAPLHNAPALRIVDMLSRLKPSLSQYGVSDSAFHRTLSPVAKTYAIPRALTERGLTRTGYHGISHEYAAHRACALAGIEIAKSRVITAHLGGGSSLCAVRNGQSIDTTMGFTPLEGVPMATRSGSVDPGLLIHLLRSGTPLDELEHMLEHDSGLLGISGITGDVKKLIAVNQEPSASRALGVLAWRVRAAIGALMATLGGVDLLVFTGGIGEHASVLREQILDGGLGLGVCLDSVANPQSLEGRISTSQSPVSIYCVTARENWQLARMLVVSSPQMKRA